jgi:hypothetical protein
VRPFIHLIVLGCAVPALGQTRPGPDEILIDATGPNARHGDPTRVPLPPEGPGRDAFMHEFLRVNLRDNEVTVDGRTLSAFVFYTQVGRTDLAAQADERTRQRIWLISGSVLTLAAGITAGVIVLANAQDPNDPSCFVNGNLSYNACIDRAQKANVTGALLIGAGVVIAASLLTWALLIPEMVTSPEETLHLVAEHNRERARRHGASGSRLELLPSVGPGGASLSLRWTF